MERKKSEIREPHDPTMGHLREETPEEARRALVNRMSRVIGHMESVKRMLEEDRDPADILIQLAAVRSAVSGVSRELLRQHIEERIHYAVDHPDEDESMEDLNKVISYFIK